MKNTPLAPQSYYSVLPSGNTLADQDLDMHLCAEMFEEEFNFTVADQSSYANTIMASPITVARSTARLSMKNINKLQTMTLDHNQVTDAKGNSLASPAFLKGSRFACYDELGDSRNKDQNSPFSQRVPDSSPELPIDSSRGIQTSIYFSRNMIGLLPIDSIEELDHEVQSVSVYNRERSSQENCVAIGYMTSPNKTKKSTFQEIAVFNSSAKELQEPGFDILAKFEKTQQKSTFTSSLRDKATIVIDKYATTSQDSLYHNRSSERPVSVTSSSQATLEYPPLPRPSKISASKTTSNCVHDTDHSKTTLENPIVSGSFKPSWPSQIVTSNSDVYNTLTFSGSPQPVNAVVKAQKPTVIVSLSDKAKKSSFKKADHSPDKYGIKNGTSFSTYVPGDSNKNSKNRNEEINPNSPSVGFDYTPKAKPKSPQKTIHSESNHEITRSSHSHSSPIQAKNTIEALKSQISGSIALTSQISVNSKAKAEKSNGNIKTKLAHSIDAKSDNTRKTSSERDIIKATKNNSKTKSKFSNVDGKDFFSKNLKQILKSTPKLTPKFKNATSSHLNTWVGRKSLKGRVSIDAHHSENTKTTDLAQLKSRTSNISDIRNSLIRVPILTRDSCNMSNIENSKTEMQMTKMLEDVKNKISRVELMVSKLTFTNKGDCKKKKTTHSGITRASVPIIESKLLNKMNISPSKTRVVSGKKSPFQLSKEEVSKIIKDNSKPKSKLGSPKLTSDRLKGRRYGIESLSSDAEQLSPLAQQTDPPSRIARTTSKSPSHYRSLELTPSVISTSLKATRLSVHKDIFHSHIQDVSIYEYKPNTQKIIISESKNSQTADNSAKPGGLSSKYGHMNSPSTRKASAKLSATKMKYVTESHKQDIKDTSTCHADDRQAACSMSRPEIESFESTHGRLLIKSKKIT